MAEGTILNFLFPRLAHAGKPAVDPNSTRVDPSQPGSIPDDPVQDAAVETPPAPADASQAAPAAQNSPAPAPVQPSKPDHLPQEDFDYLLGQGYAPEKIAQAYAPYDPSSGSYLQRIYEMSVKKPELDEEALRRRRGAAWLGDSLRLLGEMWSAGKGAHVSRQHPEEFIHRREENRQQQEKDRYQQLLGIYQRGLVDAAGKDYSLGMEMHGHNQDALRSALKDRRERAFRKEDVERSQRNTDREFELREKNAEDDRRHRRVMEQHSRNQLAETRRYHDTQIRSTRLPAGGKGTLITYRAAPGDPLAIQDPVTGVPLRQQELPYGEDYLVQMALADELLMGNHAEWEIYRPGYTPRFSAGKDQAPPVPSPEIKKRIVEAFLLQQDMQRLAAVPQAPQAQAPQASRALPSYLAPAALDSVAKWVTDISPDSVSPLSR
ncbi:MAG: hypothetical protein LBJ01_05830 [Tannerella sp.]|jgi:hypothetical protein|nr:hypothetical protein [Tannerella sp.]